MSIKVPIPPVNFPSEKNWFCCQPYPAIASGFSDEFILVANFVSFGKHSQSLGKKSLIFANKIQEVFPNDFLSEISNHLFNRRANVSDNSKFVDVVYHIADLLNQVPELNLALL